MPLILPTGLLELSAASFLSRAVPYRVYRAFQTVAPLDVVYPTRLSIGGGKTSLRSQPVRQELDTLDLQQAGFLLQTRITRLIIPQSPSRLAENELKAIYHDLLRLEEPPPKHPSFAQSIPDPSVLLPRLTRRIIAPTSTNPHLDPIQLALSSKLQSHLPPVITRPVVEHVSQGKPYSDLLNALQQEQPGSVLPVLSSRQEGVLSNATINEAEWSSLVQACLQAYDIDGLFTVLRILKKQNVAPPSDLLEYVLDFMAQDGLFREIQAFAAEFLEGRQDHPHFPYLVTALCKCRLYSTASQLLHTQEMKGHYPAEAVYRALIVGLVRSPSPGALARRAQAWDLFYHMRYVYHPSPSVSLYTDMIQACAEAAVPETLRGFDLWTEMTADKRLQPTADSYRAIIKLAARSKDTALDATRLAKEMLERGRDATGQPALPLTTDIYTALLEAAKRIGDLKQARWILTKLARSGPDGSSAIDQWSLRHMFHTYAMYSPPFKRELANKPSTSPGELSKAESQRLRHESLAVTAEDNLSDPKNGPRISAYDAVLPQTSKAILAEADALFDLLIQERLAGEDIESAPIRNRFFSNVKTSEEIAQAYISVYLHHCNSMREVIAKAISIHSQLDIEWSPDMIRICMVHCARRSSPSSFVLAEAFGEDLWQKWLSMMEQGGKYVGSWIFRGPSTPAERRVAQKHSIRPSLVTTVWASYIQLMVKSNRIDDAMRMVRHFERTYPPADSRANLSPEMTMDNTAHLNGPRALLKVMPRGLIDDDSVPPILVFGDLAPLHRALLLAERGEDIRYLTYLMHAYAGGVRDRRGTNLLVQDVEGGWRGRGRRPTAQEEELKIRARLKYERWRTIGRKKHSLLRIR